VAKYSRWEGSATHGVAHFEPGAERLSFPQTRLIFPEICREMASHPDLAPKTGRAGNHPAAFVIRAEQRLQSP
jgi:hypothetical protein